MKFFTAISLLFAPLSASPIADYCKRPDHAHTWERVEIQEGEDYKFHILNMTSQNWRSVDEVDRPTWHHWLTLTEPKKVTSNRALLVVLGGNSTDPLPQPRPEWVALANQTGSVVVEVRNIPNQPLRFADEFDERYQVVGCKEDALVAYTWDRYLETDDATWLARLPMTRSVVSAMDVVQEIAPSLLGGEIEGFVVTGRSKRGWTAWNAAGIDKRIVGVAPMVIDLLNLRQSMEHHYRSYGAWSFALADYIDRKIPQRWASEQFDNLLAIVEPYAQREQVSAPKLIVNSTGDEFFLPDSSQFYFHDLVGDKYLRYLPNASHNLRGSDADQSLALFYTALVKGRPLPKFSWKGVGGSLQVTTETKPLAVTLWTAHNPKARDFRLSTIGPVWKGKSLAFQEDGNYTIPLVQKRSGWTAYMVELKFESGEEAPHIFTTDVFVTPKTLPYEFKGYEIND